MNIFFYSVYSDCLVSSEFLFFAPLINIFFLHLLAFLHAIDLDFETDILKVDNVNMTGIDEDNVDEVISENA